MTTTSDNFKLHNVIDLTDEEFKLIADLVYQAFGINLTDKKKALVHGRLNSLIRSAGYTSFGEYYDAVLADPSGKSLLSLIDRISTNFSYFFREKDHFHYMIETALPELKNNLLKNPGELRIWSAGAASGEEAYSIAMILREYLGPEILKSRRHILATDISVSALEHAVAGIYEAKQLKEVPVRFRKYFKMIDNNHYVIADQIRNMVLFKRLNLMRERFPFKGKFHIIFCRNVMIYFDWATRKELIRKFHYFMHQGGYLFLGHSETMDRNEAQFKYIRPTVFRK